MTSRSSGTPLRRSPSLSRMRAPTSEVASRNSRLADEKEYLERELRHEFADIVGNSPALRRVLKAVKTVAPTDSTVLLLGETGTGKELIARAVHNLSPRRERTFVRMNAAALPTGLLESELFGHEKGAFTGAAAAPNRAARARRPRHALPRRSRRHSAGSPAQAAAGPAGARVRAARQHAHPARGRARRRRDEPRSRADGRGRDRSEATSTTASTSSRSTSRRCASGSRTFRRWRSTSRRQYSRRMGRQVPAIPDPRCRRSRPGLAGQHPRTAERHRAGGDRLVRSESRAAAAGPSAETPAIRIDDEALGSVNGCERLDAAGHRTRCDSAGAARIGRRHRRAVGRGRAPRAQADDAAVEDAEAGDQTADVLNR